MYVSCSAVLTRSYEDAVLPKHLFLGVVAKPAHLRRYESYIWLLATSTKLVGNASTLVFAWLCAAGSNFYSLGRASSRAALQLLHRIPVGKLGARLSIRLSNCLRCLRAHPLVCARGHFRFATDAAYSNVFHSAARDPVNATLIGVSITSVLFLSGISFAIKRGSVVEASLIVRTFRYKTAVS